MSVNEYLHAYSFADDQRVRSYIYEMVSSLVNLSPATRPQMQHRMRWYLVIPRRYLYAYRLFVAWVYRLVAQRANVLRVRC